MGSKIKLYGPPMLVDKTNFGLVIYNHASFYRFDEPSSYWSVKRISLFSAFHWSTRDTPTASQCITVQRPISKTLYNCNSRLFSLIYFSQFIHHILFNVSAKQSLIKKVFLSMLHCLPTADANHLEYFCYEQRCHNVMTSVPASQRHNITWRQTLEQQWY